jgi:anti-anti-sigma factor
VRPLQVEKTRNGSYARVALRGELDLSTVEKVETALRECLASEPTALALDLRQLIFLDSSGLRALVVAAEQAAERGVRFVLIRGPEPVQRVLRITGLDERLEIVSDPSSLEETPG